MKSTVPVSGHHGIRRYLLALPDPQIFGDRFPVTQGAHLLAVALGDQAFIDRSDPAALDEFMKQRQCRARRGKK